MRTATQPHYTHQDHTRDCARATAEGRTVSKFVQVEYEGCAQCARILSPWSTRNDKPMWKVELIDQVKGPMDFPERKVRNCSETDGRCQCEQSTSV